MFSLKGTPAEIGWAYGEKCWDGILANLKVMVHTEIPESPTSVPRREYLMKFAATLNGKCTLTEVMDFIARRDDRNPGTVHNEGSIS